MATRVDDLVVETHRLAMMELPVCTTYICSASLPGYAKFARAAAFGIGSKWLTTSKWRHDVDGIAGVLLCYFAFFNFFFQVLVQLWPLAYIQVLIAVFAEHDCPYHKALEGTILIKVAVGDGWQGDVCDT